MASQSELLPPSVDSSVNPSNVAALPNAAGRSKWWSLRTGWRLLAPSERVRSIWLWIAMILSGLLDVVALSSVMPLVSLAVQPDLAEKNRAFRILSEIAGTSDVPRLIEILAASTLGLLLLSTIIRAALQYESLRFSARCQGRLARELADLLMAVRYEWFLTHNSATVSRTIYSDVSLWGGAFLTNLALSVNSAFTMLFAIGLVIAFAPLVGLVVIAIFGAIAAGLLFLTQGPIQRLSVLRRQKSDEIMIYTLQALNGIKDIRLSSREKYFSRLVLDTFRAIADSIVAVRFLQNLPSALIIFLGQAILIGLVFVMWWRGYGAGDIAPQVALLVLVSSRVVPALNQLSGGVSQMWDTAPFIESVAALRADLESQSAQPARHSLAPRHGPWSQVRLHRVGFDYAGSKTRVLEDVSLVIEARKSYGIVGPSGSGKSTLADIILGLLQPTSGRILVDGRPYSELDIKSWQRCLAYVPQEPFLTDDTLRANVAFGVPCDKVDDARVLQCLELANLMPLVRNLVQRLDTPLYERGRRFSGGERQRIAIARALYNEPELLVLDEATSALDAASEATVRVAIENLRGRVATIVIAHKLIATQNCDEIFVLERGRLVASGTYVALLASNALFRKMAYGPSYEEPAAVQLDIQRS